MGYIIHKFFYLFIFIFLRLESMDIHIDVLSKFQTEIFKFFSSDFILIILILKAIVVIHKANYFLTFSQVCNFFELLSIFF